MNVVADESVDRPVVDRLRRDGHEVLYVAELSPSIDDESVLGRANEHGPLLITADKDFGELVFRMRRVHAGVVLLRLSGMPPQTKARLVADVLSSHGDGLTGAFSVISSGQVRIRTAS